MAKSASAKPAAPAAPAADKKPVSDNSETVTRQSLLEKLEAAEGDGMHLTAHHHSLKTLRQAVIFLLGGGE